MSLQQCLLNLSINARDASSRGGHISFRSVGGRHVEAVCSACGAAFYGEFAEVPCVDDGDGIPACSLSHVFESRFTSKSTESGYGLGLFSVNTAVHQAGGHIIIESKPGRGTSVRLLLRAPHTRETDQHHAT